MPVRIIACLPNSRKLKTSVHRPSPFSQTANLRTNNCVISSRRGSIVWPIHKMPLADRHVGNSPEKPTRRQYRSPAIHNPEKSMICQPALPHRERLIYPTSPGTSFSVCKSGGCHWPDHCPPGCGGGGIPSGTFAVMTILLFYIAYVVRTRPLRTCRFGRVNVPFSEILP